jgi:hypothetical protein
MEILDVLSFAQSGLDQLVTSAVLITVSVRSARQ